MYKFTNAAEKAQTMADPKDKPTEARFLLLGLFEYKWGLILGFFATLLALVWAWIEFEDDREQRDRFMLLSGFNGMVLFVTYYMYK